MTFEIKPRDPRIHVFSVSDGDLSLDHQTYLAQLKSGEGDGTSLVDAVGAPIDPTYAEVFAIADIAPLGLREYLAQAHDILPATLAADAARLDTLDGDVVVLAPGAVEGVDRLEPRPELTHIGSYAPAEADNAPRDLPPAAKDPRLATPATASGSPLQRKTIALIVLAALVLAALLVMLA